jgi:hypothetical protein
VSTTFQKEKEIKEIAEIERKRKRNGRGEENRHTTRTCMLKIMNPTGGGR